MKTCLLTLVILIAIIKINAQSTPCCNDVNILHKRKCLNGQNITGIICKNRYLKNVSEMVNTSWEFDDKYNLIYEDVTITPDRYCKSKLNSTQEEILLICFDSDGWSLMSHEFYAVLELISVGFIILTVIIYSQIPELLDLQGICITQSIIGLALTFLVLSIVKLTPHYVGDSFCLISAYTIYFAGLYTFFWLNALSFHIWRTIINPRVLTSVKHWKWIYHIFGIGGPTILLSILISVHHYLLSEHSDLHPGLGASTCWFKSTQTQFLYFYGPICVLIFFNIIYYIWTISVLCKEIAKCDEKKLKVLKYKLLLCIKLFFIMGISWIFEVTSAALENIHPVLNVIWHITDILNSLQGILIFLILIVFRKRVVRLLANRTICGLRLPGKWTNLTDDECDDIVEEYNLSEKN